MNKRYPEQPKNEIWFYDKGMPYYELTNFFERPLKIEKLPISPTSFETAMWESDSPLDENGKIKKGLRSCFFKDLSKKKNGMNIDMINWKTSEHLYQALKFSHSSDSYIRNMTMIYAIFKAPTAREAREEAQETQILFSGTKGMTRKDWHKGYKLLAMRWVVREKFTQHEDLRELLWKTGDKKLVEHTKNDNYWGDGGDGTGKNWLGKILMEIRQEIIEERGKVYDEPAEEPEIPEPTDKKKKEDLIEKNIQEIRNKLSAAGISSEQGFKILGNVWETNYRMSHATMTEAEIEEYKKERLKVIDEYIAKNSTNNDQNKEKKCDKCGHLFGNGKDHDEYISYDNKTYCVDCIDKKKKNSPQNSPEPTPEQVNQAKDKLNNAQNSNNKEEIINALNDTQEIAKNSSYEDLKKKREQLEDRLGQVDKSELRKIIKNEIEKELKNWEIKLDDLAPEIKKKYDELNNEIEASQSKEIRSQVLNHAAVQSLEKLITETEKALKKNNKEKIKNVTGKLREFINAKNDYQKSAYETKKNQVQQLLKQIENKNNNQEKPFFQANNPWMWLSGVGVIGFFVGIILVVRGRRGKKKVKKIQKSYKTII